MHQTSTIFRPDLHVPQRRQNARPSLYRGAGKRALDLAIVVLAMPFMAPLIAILWAVMFLGGGKGFYGQERIGRDGRVFTCWKIRTMDVDADQALARYLNADPALAREWHRNQKLDDDPRITRFGRFLRRTSLDELPQLWNVLRGEMSLVGPRPFTPDQKALYDQIPGAESYYRLRPGITGRWQVGKRNGGAFTDRVAEDDTYCAHLTLFNDLAILIRTIRVVVRATGR